nr:PREDICTED: ATP-binding cassette sub-family G member 4 [Bemisia tabaci]
MEISKPPVSLLLEFSHLTYTPTSRGSGKAPILDDCCGRFKPGRLTAIFGPSGAGKTSLLHIISGFKRFGVQGFITVNGKPRNLAEFSKLSCYITQEFAMLPVFTVRETLDIAAQLKLSEKKTIEQRAQVIENIAKLLGLYGTLETKVGNISGGEKKRLSIAVELLTNPPVMFFDEPTSGLDSVASYQLIQHLKSLAEKGRTVVVVLHQPNSKLLECIDDVMIVTEGKVLYNGPLNSLVETFKEVGAECPQYYNRADFALEVACRERGDFVDALVALNKARFEQEIDESSLDKLSPIGNKQAVYYKNEKKEANGTAKEEEKRLTEEDVQIELKTNGVKSSGEESVEVVSHGKIRRYPVSFCNQLSILFRRSLASTLRDPKLAAFRIIVHIVVGFFLGIAFKDFGNDASKLSANFSCVFFSVIFTFYGTAMHTVLIYPLEASVFIREHFNNWYSVPVYYIAKCLADLPLQIFCPTIFLTIAYWLTGQPQELDRFLMFWAVNIVLNCLAENIGAVAGTIFDPQLALFITCTITMPMFLISGFFIHLADLAPYLQWLSYLSIFRYGLEAVTLSLYGYGRKSLDCSEMFCYYRTPKKFLEEIGMDKGSYWLDLGVLTALLIFAKIGLYFVLKWRVKTAKLATLQ